jgi:hypothetical protein
MFDKEKYPPQRGPKKGKGSISAAFSNNREDIY